MSMKRIVISLAAVLVLLALAGVLELVSLAVPSEPAQEAQAPDAVPASSGTLIAEAVADARMTLDVPTEEEVRAAELVKSGEILVDGDPLQRDRAERLVKGAQPYTDRVEHINQRGVLSSGCEIVALAVALRAEGLDAEPADIADNYVHYGADFTVDYVGSPRVRGGGFPNCIVDAAKAWLADRVPSARAFNLTGTSFSGVLELASLGYPVITWTTENMASPVRQGSVKDGLQWYNPEHCVVVYGSEGDKVLVSDSLAGLVTRDRAAFERIYESCGSLAVLVEPSA